MPSRDANGNSKKGVSPVHVESLSKSFGNQTVLKGISLEVGQGETLSVLGRSGTGKSVLLKLIIGLHKPDSG
jgi:phospholipid/cholesterol/gamma-HCH transport system ATP-binding protein